MNTGTTQQYTSLVRRIIDEPNDLCNWHVFQDFLSEENLCGEDEPIRKLIEAIANIHLTSQLPLDCLRGTIDYLPIITSRYKVCWPVTNKFSTFRLLPPGTWFTEKIDAMWVESSICPERCLPYSSVMSLLEAAKPSIVFMRGFFIVDGKSNVYVNHKRASSCARLPTINEWKYSTLLLHAMGRDFPDIVYMQSESDYNPVTSSYWEWVDVAPEPHGPQQSVYAWNRKGSCVTTCRNSDWYSLPCSLPYWYRACITA